MYGAKFCCCFKAKDGCQKDVRLQTWTPTHPGEPSAPETAAAAIAGLAPPGEERHCWFAISLVSTELYASACIADN